MAEKFASNIIPKKIWTGFLSSLNLFKTLSLVLVCLPVGVASAQSSGFQSSVHLERDVVTEPGYDPVSAPVFQPDTTVTAEQDSSHYPDPESVLYKSLIIPGWGQLVNKQAWKIPIVYALIGGVAAYNIYLTKRYHDYRAAYYNTQYDDMKFGPTPDYIPGDTNSRELMNTRNRLRNRRDFTYIAIGLAYGLGALDAYVFAHMRSFDVSEDLSVKAGIEPTLMADNSPGLKLSFELFNRKKTR